MKGRWRKRGRAFAMSAYLQVVSVFENLHQGRILCAAVPQDNMLLTGGDSTVRITLKQKLLKVTYVAWYVRVFAAKCFLLINFGLRCMNIVQDLEDLLGQLSFVYNGNLIWRWNSAPKELATEAGCSLFRVLFHRLCVCGRWRMSGRENAHLFNSNWSTPSMVTLTQSHV